ncbi:unnamed protein product [Heligmosomoides polygyrus]|uniref:EB domain-containing protein n=1 Tax=Heligmosomoides polygyrus TaxID=6339 RepID=A0A183G682_HELPZ|nr:unnamed protein product [Heligmosomoides polygyrus]
MRLLVLAFFSTFLFPHLALGYTECVARACDECHFYFRIGDKCNAAGSHPVLFCDPETGVIRQTTNSFLECRNSSLVLEECAYATYYEDGRGCVDPTAVRLMQGLSAAGCFMLTYSFAKLRRRTGDSLILSSCLPVLLQPLLQCRLVLFATTQKPQIACLKTLLTLLNRFSLGSGRVGDICQYNTDCLGGMYCSGGACTCLSTYIMRENYCYESGPLAEVNPNQPGCTYDVQCEAVWPGAKCRVDSSLGTCRCPEETHVARETRDGWVCVSLRDHSSGTTVPLYFVCPLPEGAGFKIALNDPNPIAGSLPVGCTVGSSSSTEPVLGLHGGGGCIWPSTGDYIGDIYDCIHTSPRVELAKQFPQSQYALSADGVCCPSRALACTQPQVTGPNPSEPRWWYNSVTEEPFSLLLNASSSTSAVEAPVSSSCGTRALRKRSTTRRTTSGPFSTASRTAEIVSERGVWGVGAGCEGVLSACGRGSPQYSGEQRTGVERPVTSCSSSAAATCANDFQCSSVGSQHLCCPTPVSICSSRGGRPHDMTPRSSIFHQGFLVTTGRETVRFYYDTGTGRCQDFVYRGAGGNYNNFLSRHECELYCSRLQCERGSPLRIGEEPQRCQTSNQCPSSYECRADQGVCCPRKQTICAQPLRIGDCTESVKRYWYNAKARQCQMFEYTGCQGNDNNFETVLDCQSFCKNAIPEPKCIQGQAYRNPFGDFITCGTGVGCPSNHECYYDGEQRSSSAFTCSLSADPGVQCGSGSTFRYFYNAQAQNCESFQYSGCDGNSNNFATREQCEQHCSVGGKRMP